MAYVSYTERKKRIKEREAQLKERGLGLDKFDLARKEVELVGQITSGIVKDKKSGPDLDQARMYITWAGFCLSDEEWAGLSMDVIDGALDSPPWRDVTARMFRRSLTRRWTALHVYLQSNKSKLAKIRATWYVKDMVKSGLINL